MLYLHLLRHQRKDLLRSISPQYRWLALAAITVVGGYVAFLLAASGFVFTELLGRWRPGAEPVAFVQEHLLTGFVSLFLLRFFMQRTPHLKVRPYLHLPIEQDRLIFFFQIRSLASFHNLFPLLFAVPFWVRHMVLGPYTFAQALCWLIGVVAVLVVSHFGNIYLRAIIDTRMRSFAVVVGIIGTFIVLDQVAGASVLAGASVSIFGALLYGAWIMAALLFLLAWTLLLASTIALKGRLADSRSSAPAVPLWRIPFTPERGTIGNLMLLEFKLMWRNKRPRMFALSAVVFGVLYVGVMLLHAEAFSDPVSLAIIGVFASGMFALNYGQLMFSWESGYYDGVLARAHAEQDLVKAKLWLLQLSTVAFFLMSLPLFLLLAPQLVPLHLAFLFYNAGVTCMLMMLLAVSNQKRVDLSRDAALLNYEGFSLVHFLWFVPTLVPPALILFLAGSSQTVALYAIALAGLVGLMLSEQLTVVLAQLLARRKYMMAAGFKAYDH